MEGLKLKVDRKDLEGLVAAYECLGKWFEPMVIDVNHAANLLREHARLMGERLEALSKKKQKSYTVEFSYLESLAFCQIWPAVSDYLDLPAHCSMAVDEFLGVFRRSKFFIQKHN